MNILITGHKGFVGQNLYNFLRRNHNVVGYEWGDPFPQVKSYDWVIHLGAISSTTETNVRKILDQNVTFTIQLIEECIAHGVNLQFASSASVYGLHDNFKETATPSPVNHYARSKHLVEEYIRTRNAPIIIQAFRYFNVYGPGEDHKGNQASPYTQFLNQAIETGVIKVFEGSRDCKRDFINVSTICDLHDKFLNVKESGVWNFGTGEAKSFQDVAEYIADLTGCNIKTIPFPESLKPQYQYYTCADTTKLNNTLNAYT